MPRYLADAMTVAPPNLSQPLPRLAATTLAVLLCGLTAPASGSDGMAADPSSSSGSATANQKGDDQRDALDALEGTWTATNTPDQARDRIDEQIDAVVGEMSFIKRPFARRRLKKVTEPCQTTSLRRLPEARIEIHCKARKPAVAPLDGTPVQWTDEDGETYTLTQHVHDDRIVQTFEGGDGTRRNIYRPDGDTMVMDARLTSDQLPEPLTFRRTYKRQ